MGIDSQLKRYSAVAIFSRNHKNLLDEAVAISAIKPNQEITFRARSKWQSADKAIHLHGPRPIYFVPIDDLDALIKYVATLNFVVLQPTDTQATRDLLDKSVPSTVGRSEGLWLENGKPTVNTLYVISNCRKLQLNDWLPFTQFKRNSRMVSVLMRTSAIAMQLFTATQTCHNIEPGKLLVQRKAP